VTVMMLESNGYAVGEYRLWCWRVSVMVLESNGYGVREQRLWCLRVTFIMFQRVPRLAKTLYTPFAIYNDNGYGVRE
jgi:hypothetical protein